jgi:hypothetical protein
MSRLENAIEVLMKENEATKSKLKTMQECKFKRRLPLEMVLRFYHN